MQFVDAHSDYFCVVLVVEGDGVECSVVECDVNSLKRGKNEIASHILLCSRALRAASASASASAISSADGTIQELSGSSLMTLH